MAESQGTEPGFAQLIDLASDRLGARVVLANDEFFAPKVNLLKADKPVFIPGKFTEFGKWMDGWETRRRREPGHDWCLIRLGVPGVVRGFNVDTSHFSGNQPEACTIEGAELQPDPTAEEVDNGAIAWCTVLDRTPLKPSAEHLLPAIDTDRRLTHLRFNIFPDGGVARLRAFGEARPDWERITQAKGLIDLGAAEHGGLVVACNDMHFGSRHNLIMPGRAPNMGDGWETRRRRGAGFDWCIVRLGRRGIIHKIEVDTNHFKGNYPESCMIEACDEPDRAPLAVPPEHAAWRPLLSRTKLRPDFRHFFATEPQSHAPSTHVRLSIYPDGGVSRLRLHGTLA